MPLTETQAKNAKPRERAYKLADSEGLFLLVQPIPALAWIPLAIVWLGLGDAAQQVAAAFGLDSDERLSVGEAADEVGERVPTPDVAPEVCSDFAGWPFSVNIHSHELSPSMMWV